MAELTIMISIDENGKINAETSGVKGKMCLEQLQELLENEGDILSIKKTDEYFQQHNVKNQIQIQNKK